MPDFDVQRYPVLTRMENSSAEPPCSPAPLAEDVALPAPPAVEDATPLLLSVGCQVRIKDIVSRPEINGCTGIIIGQFDSEKRRWPVEVMLKTGDRVRLQHTSEICL